MQSLCACFESADTTKSRWNPVSKRSEVRKLHFGIPLIRKGGRGWLRSHTYSKETNECCMLLSALMISQVSFHYPDSEEHTLCVLLHQKEKKSSFILSYNNCRRLCWGRFLKLLK